MKHKCSIVACGYIAESGKGEVVSYLTKAYAGCNPLVISFASALRKEIHDEMQTIMAGYLCPSREALEILCMRKGAKFDPFAKPDINNPFGKQRSLQQHVGMARRAQCATYWIDKVEAEIERVKPRIVFIDDLRLPNEAEWTSSNGGFSVHVDRPDHKGLQGEAASHISEHALHGYNFDRKIVNDSSLSVLHKRAATVALELLQGNLPF